MWRPKAVSFTPEEKVVDKVPQRVERPVLGILPHSRADTIPPIHNQPSQTASCNNKCSSVLTASYGSLGRLEVTCPRSSYIQLPPPPMPSFRSMVCRNRAQQSKTTVAEAPSNKQNGIPCVRGEVEASLKRDVSCSSLGHPKVGHPDLTIRKCETAMGLSSLAVEDPVQKPNPAQCSTKMALGCLNQNGRSIPPSRIASRKEKECKRPFVSSRNLISASTRNLLLPLRKEFSASCTSTNSSSFSPSATSPLLHLQNSGHGSGMLEHSGDTEGPMKPVNRLRVSCSRCSSLVSLSASRLSLGVTSVLPTVQAVAQEEDETGEDKISLAKVEMKDIPEDKSESCNNVGLTMSMDRSDSDISLEVPSSLSLCKLCLTENVTGSMVVKIQQCGCLFCQDCMSSYVAFEIQEGAYDISCPDAQCPAQGALSMVEIEHLVGPDLTEKHHRFRLNKEVDLDVNRTWCPVAGCETVCTIHPPPNDSSPVTTPCQPWEMGKSPNGFCMCPPQRVVCPTCSFDFCSACKKPSHVGMSCDVAAQLWRGRWGTSNQVAQLLLPPGVPLDSDLIKCCPMCSVPIEKDEGCAQMMCKRCKHVFCWYCLASLDDDFLLRHYDKGPCKNKLGHSRASVIWHRAQVIGIFAGFGILLLVASPLLLLAAPCILCCKCRVCSGGGGGVNGEKLEEEEEEEGGGESIGIVAGKVAARSIKANATVSDTTEMPRESS
ncbi:uncharacterized protein LOC124163207 [Ischnura elegans]|uniref:uncharacterized protein LOC124163207 n=1 Tax=Ischnura elegans TaxID=197161 RepID=UPI001ED881ED|nr:uncharacterized protein LOC124163207 [Ischnura elegans]XP_046395896.1 uncharacterized protein LOC124163207 [Ischnura elegans]